MVCKYFLLVWFMSAKMNIFVSFLLVLACFSQVFGEKVRYDGFKVYRITPKSKEAAEALRALEESESGYDFWTGVRGVGIPVDIMVPPHYKYRFNDMTSGGLFDVETFIPDVQKLIDNETPKGRSATPRALDWTKYSILDEIYAWLDSLEEEYPDLITGFTAGTSYEGREIKGVKLSYHEDNKKRSVFVESNIHAREWITSATTTWILNEFLTTTDPIARQVIETHDWYFVPVFNPDGFVYTHTTERMWRKTRIPYFLCYGADPNRNWGHHYNDGGSSPNPCSETYRGPEAFSETSTNTTSQYIASVAEDLIGYISFHSYSQLLLLPYGYSSAHLDNYDDLYTVGVKAAESLAQRYDTQYTVGNIVEVLYVASGGSMDWVKGSFGTPITYTYELRDRGQYGFILPPEQIIPTAQETYDSFITIFQEFAEILNGTTAYKDL